MFSSNERQYYYMRAFAHTMTESNETIESFKALKMINCKTWFQTRRVVFFLNVHSDHKLCALSIKKDRLESFSRNQFVHQNSSRKQVVRHKFNDKRWQGLEKEMKHSNKCNEFKIFTVNTFSSITVDRRHYQQVERHTVQKR